MGTYVYKIGRKGRKVKGSPTFDGKIYEAEFAYKTGGIYDGDNLFSKYIAPTKRAWDKALFDVFFDVNTLDRVYFVMDWTDGAPVYHRKTVSWYDDRPHGTVVGHIYQSGESARFRFVPAKKKLFDVTFEGKTGFCTYRVWAACENSAHEIASEMLTNGAGWSEFNSRYPKIEQPMTKRRALKKAYEAMKSDKSISLSDRMAARRELNEILETLPREKTGLLEYECQDSAAAS